MHRREWRWENCEFRVERWFIRAKEAVAATLGAVLPSPSHLKILDFVSISKDPNPTQWPPTDDGKRFANNEANRHQQTSKEYPSSLLFCIILSLRSSVPLRLVANTYHHHLISSRWRFPSQITWRWQYEYVSPSSLPTLYLSAPSQTPSHHRSPCWLHQSHPSLSCCQLSFSLLEHLSSPEFSPQLLLLSS